MPIISPWLFYYNSIYDALSFLLIGAILIGGIFWIGTFLLLTGEFGDLGNDIKWITSINRTSKIFFIISFLLMVFLPSGEAVLQMAIANVATTDNIALIYETLFGGF